jgi:DNA-damage-inducible protein J
MKKMTQIQIRIDEKTKKDAQAILSEVGMDLSSAIKVYLKQIIIYKGLPMKVLTENGFTIEQEKEIIKASEEAKLGINVVEARTAKEAAAYFDKLKKKR